MVLLPLANLAELVEQENAAPLRLPDGLHDPHRPGGALELFDEHAVLGREDESAGPEAAAYSSPRATKRAE